MSGVFGNKGNRTKKYNFNLVEFVIQEHFHGCAAELARQLSSFTGNDFSRQTIHGWRRREKFSREVIPAVSKLTGIDPMTLINSRINIK